MARILFVIYLIFSGLIWKAPAQNCPIETGNVAGSYFRKEKRRVIIHKLDELPSTIALKTKEHLKSRVGEKFLSNLKFGYGYAVTFKSGQTDENAIIRKADAYILVFTYSNRSKGIREFRFDIAANADGSLFRDFYFPNLVVNPKKTDIISCRQAVEIAVKNGFQPGEMFPRLEIEAASDSFVWVLIDPKPAVPDKPLAIGRGAYRQIVIDAVSGKVLRIKEMIILI